MGRDDRRARNKAEQIDFNPLSPHGERPGSSSSRVMPSTFQSTLPAWGETKNDLPAVFHRKFQSTLPAWGETPPDTKVLMLGVFQSTLPAWGETGDRCTGCPFLRYFNPLSPHGERPARHGHTHRRTVHFNPLSPHGERRQGFARRARARLISIHSPRMGRDEYGGMSAADIEISIHSPRMGRD